MKKQLVGVDNLDAHICQASGKLYADGSIILTAGAKDELVKRGIGIVYGPKPGACPPGCTCPACMSAHACPPGCTCEACTANAGLEKLILGIAVILKEQYGITDLEQLKTLSCQIVKAIKNNL